MLLNYPIIKWRNVYVFFLYEFWSRGIILTVLWGILCMTSTKAEAWNARSTTEFLYYIFSLEGKSMTDRLRSYDQLGLEKYSNLLLSHLSIISCKNFTLCILCIRLLSKHVFHFNGCSGGDFHFPLPWKRSYDHPPLFLYVDIQTFVW